MQKSPPEFPQGHHTLFSLATPFTMALDVFSLLGVCALGAAWPVLWRPWRTQELPRTTALSPCSRVLWSERPASGKSQFSRMDAYRWEFMSCPVGVNIYTNNVLIILVTDVYELFLCVYLGFLFFFFLVSIQGADISSSQHQEMILWLGEMCRLFQFCPETFALGVCVLNRLLSSVKVR